MPQLIALALVGAGIYAGARLVGRALAHMAEDLRQAQAEARARATAEPKNLGKLVWDSEIGAYRPERR